MKRTSYASPPPLSGEISPMGPNANPRDGGAAPSPSTLHTSGAAAGGHERNPSPAGGGEGAAATAQALRHNPGLALRWSAHEQTILEEGLSKYASEPILSRYAKITLLLTEKTVRDVALRCQWMSKKENSKKRKDEHSAARKSKDKKESVTDTLAKPTTQVAGRPNAPLSFQMLLSDDDDIPSIGGPTGELLEHNSQILNQISTSFSSMQGQDTISLLCQARDNILSVLKDIDESVPTTMKQMPPLPAKIKEDLANSILPRPPGSICS